MSEFVIGVVQALGAFCVAILMACLVEIIISEVSADDE